MLFHSGKSKAWIRRGVDSVALGRSFVLDRRAAQGNGAALIRQAGSLPLIATIYKIKTSEFQPEVCYVAFVVLPKKKLLLISLIVS